MKELEKAKKRLEDKLDELADRKTDDMLTFEQLGVDGLIVDEAHRYKKLEFTSQMDNIKGLDRGYSQRGFGLFMKTRYIQERATPAATSCWRPARPSPTRWPRRGT